jgi:ASC-1-like (ASCH) protein
MLHQMKLQPNPFEQIKNGSKTLELRLNDEKRQLIKVGDEIEFSLAALGPCRRLF